MRERRPAAQLERESYDGASLRLPELVVLGWTSTATTGELKLGEHSHRGAYEICLLMGGHVTWWAGEQLHALRPGDVYVTRPGERHGGVDDVLQACSLYWLQVRLGRRSGLSGMTPTESRSIRQTYRRLSNRCFPASDALVEAFSGLHAEFRRGSDLSAVAARSLFHLLLLQVARDHDAAAASGPRRGKPSKPIQRAIDEVASDLGESVRVEDLARRVGLGVSRFHERFVAEVGFSPADYRMHLRIRQARQWLAETDRSITDIALALGFSSSQHFATAFRRVAGFSPSAFRKRVRPGEAS